MSSSNCNLEAFLATWNQGAYISALPGILRKDIGNLERSSPSRSDPHTLSGVSCPLVLLSYQAWRTMASRAAPSGIALDIRRKLDASYDIDGELNARLWIEDVTGILMDDPPAEVESLEQLNEWRINHRELGSRQFARVLKDGIFLCKLVNTLEPGTIKKIHEEKLSRFKMQENIFNFLKAAKTWGCTEQDLFQTVDLYEERNMNQVLNGIYAVARKVQDRISDDKFPTLGPKEAKYNPRDFTEEQLNRGKHVCALRF